MTIRGFIDNLASLNTPDDMSINMYHEDTKEAEDRRKNLLYYLETIKEINPTHLLVGEAPGRFGCYLTGIPFTDEHTMVHIPLFQSLDCLVKELMELDSSIKPQKEGTATTIWSCLSLLPHSSWPLMWNIYPFHPSSKPANYLSANDRTNRPPSPKELKLGLSVLKDLLQCFDIDKIIAIGRISESILKKEFPNISYIRHPAHGGTAKFKAGFNDIFQL